MCLYVSVLTSFLIDNPLLIVSPPPPHSTWEERRGGARGGVWRRLPCVRACLRRTVVSVDVASVSAAPVIPGERGHPGSSGRGLLSASPGARHPPRRPVCRRRPTHS